MKKILMTLSFLVLSAAAVASEVQPMTFDSFYLTKDTKNQYGVVYIPSRTISLWCAGLGNPLQIMSYDAAQTLDGLSDGLYNCTGKFVQIPTDRAYPIQIFQIDACTQLNAADLRAASCKTTK